MVLKDPFASRWAEEEERTASEENASWRLVQLYGSPCEFYLEGCVYFDEGVKGGQVELSDLPPVT